MILHRDPHIVVANKSAGEIVHRGWAKDGPILMFRVRDQIGAHVYPVHRLDRGTSGVTVFALSSQIARALQQQFTDHSIVKLYWALVRGNPGRGNRGTIDHPIPRAEEGPRVPAQTDWRCAMEFGRYSLLEARPHTGRLHRIRRHFKHLSWPLIGDVKYGKGEHNRLFRGDYGLHRLALHAHRLELSHPVTAERLSFTAPMPADLAEPLARLAEQSGVALQEFRQLVLTGKDV